MKRISIDISKLFERISGPPIVFISLLRCITDKLTENVNLNDICINIEKLEVSAYIKWKGYIQNKLTPSAPPNSGSLTNNFTPRSCLSSEEVLKLYCGLYLFPIFYGGECKNNLIEYKSNSDGYKLIYDEMDSISEGGLLRLFLIDGSIIIQKPYPFLRKYINKKIKNL